MHKFTPLIAAAAVCVAGVSLAGRADAGALVGADGLRPALDQMSITETVHCTPGIAHRRSHPRDGCYRRVYRAPACPSVRLWPVAYGYPYGYGPAGDRRRGWRLGPSRLGLGPRRGHRLRLVAATICVELS